MSKTIVLALLAARAAAGPVLDDLLNYPVVDQRCPAESIKEEAAMGLVSQGRASFIELSREQPLGQTFRLGPDAHVLWRVCVGLCHWPDSWQQGEEVTFKLYDSPQRKNVLYSRTIDYDHKWFKWDVAYDIHLPTEPNTEYYFELTHNGAGDDKINVACIRSDAYPHGTAYVAGQPRPELDLYFVVITKPRGDREQNLDRLISRFDLSRPELAAAREAVQKRDREKACAAILAWFDKYMKSADWVWRLGPNEKPDTSRMDRVCDQGRLYRNDAEHPDQWIPMGEETTWREVWPETSEYVRMNDLFAELGRAYAATRDDKYARKLDQLMADYMQDNASPFEGGMRGGRWVAMFQAWRLGDAWDGVANAIDSPALTADVKLAWLDYWARMAHFAMTEPSGGNHANAVAEALMKFATRFPVYKDSRTWFEFGWRKLVSNSLKLFRDDGGCVEPAMNYHGFSLGNLQAGIETARAFGIKPPFELNAKLEKALAYTAYMLKPDGQIPSYGDTDCEDYRPDGRKWDGWRKGEAMDGARLFGRRDLLYIATAGKEGTRPAFDSYRFPDTGHYILRSGWGDEEGEKFEDARYLFLRGGWFGSHGHDDLNAVTLYAYGRPLLIDPGRTTYGTPLMVELSKNRSHNVLLVDDLDMNHAAPRLDVWYTSRVMDCVQNSYPELYPGVEHRRAVVFARPDYYLVFDRASSARAHNFGVNFWTTPPAVTIDECGTRVHTNEP
ncbi:MAG: heparinase II/III family protein, partial [Armatimonadota bacterium]